MLLTSENLEKERLYEDPKEALSKKDLVIRLSLYQIEDLELIKRISELRNLQDLRISLVDLQNSLVDFSNFKLLQNLSLQCCQVDAVPESIQHLKHLRSLSMGNNQIKELPSWLGKMEHLQDIAFPQNELAKFPECLLTLKHLHTLNLSYNCIKQISSSISALTKLTTLLLNSNNIEILPSEVGLLSSLKFLSLDYNELKTLPVSIANLKQLESLSLNSNSFESLPKELAQLSDIEHFEIDGVHRPLFMDWSYKHSPDPVQKNISDFKLFVSSHPKLSKKLKAIIKSFGLAKMEDQILSLAQASIDIKTTKKHTYKKIGLSRFGGYPDLPDDSYYPKTDGMYWSFLCQINLSDIQDMGIFCHQKGYFYSSLNQRNL